MSYTPFLNGIRNGVAINAGYTGQIAQAFSGNGSAASNSITNLVSLTLQPGSWIISGCAVGTTSGSTITVGISTANNSLANIAVNKFGVNPLSGNNYISAPNIFVNISSATTYYLNVQLVLSSYTYTSATNLIATRIG